MTLAINGAKKCSRCKKSKPTSQFNKSKSQRDGLSNNCRECCSALSKERNAEIRRTRGFNNPIAKEGFKICFTCKEEKPINEFYSNKAKSNGRYGSCKECVKKRNKFPRSLECQILYLPHLLEIEEWSNVVINDIIFPYLISDNGRVRILKSNKIAKPSFDQRGYPQIVMSHLGKRVGRRIHILVAMAFLDNPNNLPEVNHLNGNKLFPHKSNLVYSTSKDNVDHAIKNGLRKPFTIINHPNRKKLINEITGERFGSVSEAAAHYGIPKTILSSKLSGRITNNTGLKYDN